MDCASLVGAIGAIGALMNRVLQPRPLVVLGLNVCDYPLGDMLVSHGYLAHKKPPPPSTLQQD